MPTLAPEQQWEQINYSRDFLIAVLGQVEAVWDALESLDATAPKIETDVNDVPIKISRSDKGKDFVFIEIGETTQKEPQVVLDIPKKWVTEHA